jgi:hypothetical protein
MFKSSSFNPNAGSSVPKILTPGTHYCRIMEIKLDTPPYDAEAYSINLLLEGTDRGDEFQGVAIDKNRPELGTYRGQIANVRSGRYPFSTYEFQGKTIQRDDQIFRWVNNLAKQMGVLDRMNADGLQADTIEEYVSAVAKYLTDPELWGYFTIGGQEYFQEGYDKPNYRMFFPKQEGKNFPFSALENDDRQPLNLLPFDRDKHIIADKSRSDAAPAESVSGFGGQADPLGGLGSAPTAGLGDLQLP